MEHGEIRLLHPEEWRKLAPIFEAEGGHLPNTQYATAAVAIDDAGIAGFWTLQPVLHAGPLWIREDKRGTGLWRPLNQALVDLVSASGSGFYSFSDGPRMDHVFTQLGYVDLNYRVWKKEV